jgi:hypothetical protein
LSGPPWCVVSLIVSPASPLAPAPGTSTRTGPVTGRLSMPDVPVVASIGRSVPTLTDSTVPTPGR